MRTYYDHILLWWKLALVFALVFYHLFIKKHIAESLIHIFFTKKIKKKGSKNCRYLC
jgi:hypothetical protein